MGAYYLQSPLQCAAAYPHPPGTITTAHDNQPARARRPREHRVADHRPGATEQGSASSGPAAGRLKVLEQFVFSQSPSETLH